MADRHLTIVTGASRGLGRAIAAQRLAQGHAVLALSRRPDATLAGAALEQWAIDLADPLPVAARLEAWLAAQDGAAWAGVAIVHNAALLTPPGPSEAVAPGALSAALRVGLEAPVLLTAAFLRATGHWPGVRKVLSISSGLGRRAMAGAAPYCAVKAGLDHHARAVALDEALKPRGARIVSLAPGVIDTDMQVALRRAEAVGFPDLEMFRQLKSRGALATPEAAAARVLGYLDRTDYGQNPVADVRDA
jgi:NAD(P)-dependent dehydrogenase (short-subunit alcohol dehydrogenase family)